MSADARSVADALTVSGQPLFGSHRHSDRRVCQLGVTFRTLDCWLGSYVEPSRQMAYSTPASLRATATVATNL